MTLTDLLQRLRPRRELPVEAPAAPARPHGFIDVRELIERLDDETLMRSADDYFANISPTSEQCHKPWGNPVGAVHQTRHLGLVLEAADLFRGASVLDFGCATGWLTIGLSQMGCDAIGVDIAPNALKLARQQKGRRPTAQGQGSVSFCAYDGQRLPLPDASLDRIICFDAFHHVRDQAATIQEFARVLRPGGRAAFIEPGPNHSSTPQSQAEMARFQVIENDVRMQDIQRHALAAGFEPPRMLVQFQQPFTVDAEDFLAWSSKGLPATVAARFMSTLQRQLTDGQCFFIVRRGDAAGPDSRRPDGLGARIEVRKAEQLPAGRGIRLELRVRNTGCARWLTDSGPGQVNLGVQILDVSGRLVDDNHARLRLPRGAVEPGAEVEVAGVVPRPSAAEFMLRLDLVAELVTWFGARDDGSVTVVPSSRLS